MSGQLSKARQRTKKQPIVQLMGFAIACLICTDASAHSPPPSQALSSVVSTNRVEAPRSVLAAAASPFEWTGPGVLVAQSTTDSLFGIDPEKPETAPDVETVPAVDSATDAPSSSEPASTKSLFGVEPEPKAESGGGWSGAIDGFIQNEGAYTYPSPDHYSKLRTTLDVSTHGEFSANVKWKLGARLLYDANFDLTSFYPGRVRDDQRFDADFRENYLDISANDFEFRVGRQHIVWGEVPGIFVADVVSAKDFQEFILPDFELLRIPQWAARAEYFQGDFHGELVWIPIMTYDDVGEAGSEFFPLTLPVPPGFTTVVQSDDTPSDALSNSGFGARASYLTNGWDSSLFYYSSLDHSPAFERTVVAGATTPTLSFNPIHRRTHNIGATVTKDFDWALLRGEAVYVKDRLFSVTNLTDPDGLVRQDFVDYSLSAERVFPEQSRVNVQFFQRWFTDHNTSIIPSELESGFTVFADTEIISPNLKPELLWIRSLNRDDWLLQAKLTWKFKQDWRFVVGADVFSGSPTGLFGQFDAKDRVYYELRHTF